MRLKSKFVSFRRAAAALMENIAPLRAGGGRGRRGFIVVNRLDGASISARGTRFRRKGDRRFVEGCRFAARHDSGPPQKI
jgi:hypothetical protein